MNQGHMNKHFSWKLLNRQCNWVESEVWGLPKDQTVEMRTRCCIQPNHGQFLVIILWIRLQSLVRQKGAAVCWPGFTFRYFPQETWPHLNCHLWACEHWVCSVQMRSRRAAGVAGTDCPRQAAGISVWPAPVLKSGRAALWRLPQTGTKGESV